MSEEALEVAHRVSKLLRFGQEEVQSGQLLTNTERVVEELQDLNAVVAMLVRDGLLPASAILPNPDKEAKIERYSAISKKIGCLTESTKEDR
jgi:hypothetical protein